MRIRNCMTIFATSLLFLGCTPSVDPHINMEPPVYVEQLPSKDSGSGQSNAGSLYGRGKDPLFSDRKAMNVNDIVTIVISETASQTSTGSKQTSKNSTTSLGAGTFTAGGSPLSNVARQLNKYGNIGFSAGGENSFNGSGTTSRNERFNATISARIIKILNNGNYFIEGNRELLINGEKQIMQVSGVIRPYDISQTNEIDSRYIADAKILYKTEGDVDRSTKKPWGTRIMEAIWPF
ncbi:flagellar basal body L-ring protein FlgH [Campylobacter sp. RM9344]|uniref:Flagellar L-ring protein n=1 Tax=Campylobacter californiensis TaxID=1032243 RepID=A0AAW3ZU13_9BACT|nr:MULTISPECIES: flagellar basal body L-ring protein FlgH [unclassified Campylobacter]MBE2984344.1 flagellar basal body L-ring protein FlgH [Campylobacter sp. RM6883]MBE2985902.1 flagellar basal body L-ring protein FlgH [Campylobacter sp. RM12919]MBE2988103.1 flagellar basal body L-ring protein FlgH [Campylobacter sp. RM12920]MBE2994789.1 flagellar basal body L-ring protein FlgH [Campylobacter sp. RM6913]MBE3021439.1 flagellar basal body L-ring protein FlgH [Campylobacter sp. 7477a]MBE3030136